MKKGLSVLVLCVILAHFAGFYVYFAAQLVQIKSDMRLRLQHLPDEELDIVTLPPAAFAKARVNDHEIKVNGNMYDIARVTHTTESVIVYCLRDEAEDNLFSLLDAVLKNAHSDKRSSQQLIQFTLLLYIPAASAFDFTLSLQQRGNKSSYLLAEYSYDASVLSPPPRS